MDREDFIRDALYKPGDYIAYHVGRELAELYPQKSIIETETTAFDLEAFARDQQCSIVHETSLFNHIKTQWTPGTRLRRAIENSWLNVLWKGNLLDVVMVTFDYDRHCWIVADDRQLAEEFFTAVCEWSTEVRGEVLVFHDGAWSKNQELYKSIKSATFTNLILRAGLQEEMQRDFTQFLAARESYERYGIPWKRGVLFTGPPGNGKTHTVKALVNHLARPCLYVKTFKSDYNCEPENIRRVFARARATTPCLLVLEDLDSLVDEKTRSFFLNELDGFEANTGIVVVATTNYPEKLDPAIVDRPSRFDRKYHFDLPGPAERGTYIRFWNEQSQPELRVSAKAAIDLVRMTEGFSFAYLKELFLSAMMLWVNEAGRPSMDRIILNQVARLQNQMKEKHQARAVSA